MFVFSLLGFVLLTPLLYVQIINIVTGTTTHDRFAFQERTSRSFKENGDIFMLLSEEEQIESIFSSNVVRSALFLEASTQCCCFQSKREVEYRPNL